MMVMSNLLRLLPFPMVMGLLCGGLSSCDDGCHECVQPQVENSAGSEPPEENLQVGETLEQDRMTYEKAKAALEEAEE